MSISEPLGRRAPGQQQLAVIEAATALFIARGVAATKIEEIAKRAGVAKGTVYLYFPSKADILAAIEMRVNAKIVARTCAAAADVSGTTCDIVRAWCVEFVHAYLDELQVHEMLFSNGTSSSARAAVADNSIIDELAALLAGDSEARPQAMAAFLVGGITMLGDRAVIDHRPVDVAGLASAASGIVNAVIPHRKPCPH